MDSFFIRLVPFIDCSKRLLCLVCMYNVSSAAVGGLSDCWVINVAVVVSCSCLDFALVLADFASVLAEWG